MFVLTFHRLGGPQDGLNDAEYCCDPDVFAAVLDVLRHRSDVQITFDDANESDYTVALPLLMERNMRAQFFVVAARIDQPGFLSREQMKEMSAHGMPIQNHGMWHTNWSRLGERQLTEEIVQARESIEQITGAAVTAASCPFGGYNRRVLRALKQSAYGVVYTSDGGPVRAGQWLQARNTIKRHHNPEQVVATLVERSLGNRLGRAAKLAIKRWR